MKKKINEIRKRGKELCWKRYMGEIIEADEDIIPYEETKYELGNYMTNFSIAGTPIKKEIIIAKKLIDELEQVAIKKDVDLSTLISTYLLDMLERNYPTRVFAKGKTKGKISYILNNLYDMSNFIQYSESKEEFKENIFSNRELEESLTYETTIFDEYIYIEKYLITKNYTKEQIEEIQKEEWEKFGVTKNCGVKMVKPYVLTLEHKFNIEAFNFESTQPVYVSARLGFHYLLVKKSKELKTYEEIEEIINKKILNGGDKIWDSYKEFLEVKIPEKNMV